MKPLDVRTILQEVFDRAGVKLEKVKDVPSLIELAMDCYTDTARVFSKRDATNERIGTEEATEILNETATRLAVEVHKKANDK